MKTNDDFKYMPYSLDELKELEAHLDDESEWENMEEFWEAWGPRINDRIKRLIITAKLAHEKSIVSSKACFECRKRMCQAVSIMGIKRG